MLRPSEAIYGILVNKLIYIIIENSFPKDPQGFCTSNIESWLQGHAWQTFMAKIERMEQELWMWEVIFAS